jgi:3-deoxy-D-manno-octulosonic-acid transferase
MAWIANFVYILAALAYLPVLFYQMVAQRKNRHGWGERFFGPRIAAPRRGEGARIWVHAVSLGEINAARQLIAGLAQRFPGCEVVVSTTTDTGHAQAVKLFGADRVFRYPLDFSWTIARALRRVAPCAIVLVELEVWFNLVTMAGKRGIPVCVVNGRLTERSGRRLRRLGPLSRMMFHALRWVGAQDDAIAERFQSLGVPSERVEVTGSVKWDTAKVADAIEGADELAACVGINRDRPLWVCGSTGVGEEALILDAYRALCECGEVITLAIIPRKPERFDQVADLIRRAGFACVRRSEHKGHSASVPEWPHDGEGRPPVVLGDTMGELRAFYSLADVVFVGRSLVPMGGSDPMEVAALAKPMVVGPHMDNFQMPAAALEASGGLRVVRTNEELADVVRRLAGDRATARRLGEAARAVVLQNQGATERTLDTLSRIIQESAARSAVSSSMPDHNM